MPPAWKASGSSKAPPPQLTQGKKDGSTYPGLKPESPVKGSKTQYLDIQQDEIMVLKSMYDDDLIEHKAVHSAWNKSQLSFDLRIKATLDEEFNIILGVVMVPTYPKSPPLLSLKDHSNLGEATLFKIEKLVETKPKELVAHEQPMIHELVLDIQTILDEAAEAKAQGLDVPSLEEERVAHEAELARRAQQQQAENERKKQQETEEEERVMKKMVEEELERQRLKAKRNRSHQRTIHFSEDSAESDADKVIFDQTCKCTDLSGNDVFFTTVTGKTEYRRSLIATIYTVRPLVAKSAFCPTLALKEFHLKPNHEDAGQFRKQLVSLEKKLISVKKLTHQNVVELIDFRIDRDTQEPDNSFLNRIVRVLMPFSAKGTLDELLDLTDQLAISKVRSWTTDLLSALGYLHGQGIVHESIHPGNILLFRESSGHVVPKLADVTYQRELHAICRQSRTIPSMSSPKSAYWHPPELASHSGTGNQKTDIWDFGVVFLQMIFGLDIFEKYKSPAALMDSLALSSSLHELVTRFFRADPGRRSRALDLRSSEFLATDAPVLVEDTTAMLSPSQDMVSLPQFFSRGRLNSSTQAPAPSFSRFRSEFIEEGRLGKGGFGEVVRVRKKIEGQVYAIKKISQRASKSLSTILKEVSTLSRLSHPAIVRYYDAWIEQVYDASDADGDITTESLGTEKPLEEESNGVDIQFGTNTGGLDFMSSTNHGIEFGLDESDSEDDEAVVSDDDDTDDDAEDDDDEEDESEEDEEEDDNSESRSTGGGSLAPTRSKQARIHQKPFRNVLYILMEYCDKKSLRDLISQNLYQETEEVWRLFRQILEGLVYIHSLHNVVHRDLKPENIFISRGSDGITHVKIGDFGLATTGQAASAKGSMDSPDAIEMSNVGTAIYQAPELENIAKLDDSKKIDMYSLGIIFFEMCYKPMIGHERWVVLKDLREKTPRLPDDFKPSDKLQTEIILSLVTHNPNERPSSSDLLRSGKLPVPMENENIQRAIAEVSDAASPYHAKLMGALFSTPPTDGMTRAEKTKLYAWDMSAPNPSSTELLYQGIVKDELTAVFRRHGAVEASRNPLYPRSSHYTQNVMKLLDQDGTVVQLPYDLMLGHARVLAKHTGPNFVPKSFAFGSIYRDKQNGGQPSIFGEVAFDIVSIDTLDLALKEAEVIKVLDEIIQALPSLSQMCFHVSHSDLLQLIFDYCGVSKSVRKSAAEVLSKLNVQAWTWQKIRPELSQLGLSVNNLDELEQFDFRAFSKLKKLFQGSPVFEKAQSTLAHLKDVIGYTKLLGVQNKIFVNPLSSFREDFFIGGFLFQCIYDKKRRDVFAAGGRYDSLIREHRLEDKNNSKPDQRHAVGFSLSWERLATRPKTGGKSFLKKPETESQGIFNTKRCDVLVASFDPGILRSIGVELLQTLWAHDISAELARDSRSPEDLLTRHRDETYSWIVIIKQDGLLKIKSMGRKDVADAEVHTPNLLSWLRTEMRERDRHVTLRQVDPSSNVAAGDKAGMAANKDQDVRVLVSSNKSKKFNRRIVVEQAQANAATLVQTFLDGPIAAIETSDAVLEIIQQTTLSDAESWRKAERAVNMSERKYLDELHDMLLSWRNAWKTEKGTRNAFVYNFRTTKCIYYDLGL